MLLGALLAVTLAGPTPEERAIAFLAREVPRWPAENQCYSCHNNGDAARALYVARRLGYAVPPEALESTTAWLSRPATWDENKGDPRFSDKVLARIQFAGALADSQSSASALAEAASLVARDQAPDGSWRLDSSESIGSPATYGTVLATSVARRILTRAGEGFASSTERADRWLRERKLKTVLDAAAVLLGLESSADDVRQRRLAIEILTKGETPTGGWGPYVTSAPQVFDTAIVILALGSVSSNELPDAVARGREFLLGEQLPDGSFLETTRPPGQRSYAQYISTTGWATLALLATRER